MKSIKFIASVLSLHLFVVLALLVQPGCQTTSSKHVTSKEITIKDYLKEDAGEEHYASAKSAPFRAQPTRPAHDEHQDDNTQINDDLGSHILEPIKASESSKLAHASEDTMIYEVKRGDNLWIISKKVSVPVAKIAKANNLTQDSILKIGQKLSIPKGAANTGVVASGGSTSDSTNSSSDTTYLVQRGDTLSTIATRLHTSVSSIKLANNLRSNVIYVGQKLKIPAATESSSNAAIAQISAPVVASAKPAVHQGGTYTVRSGQTLSDIAHITGVRVAQLMEYNGITDPRRLRAEQVLRLTPPTGTAMTASVQSTPAVSAPKVVPQETSAPQAAPTDVDSFFDTTDEIPWVSVESSEGNATT